MFIPPKTESVVHIFNKKINLQTCDHLNKNNVKKDLILYKVIKENDTITYYGTCKLCYMTNISRKHVGRNDD